MKGAQTMLHKFRPVLVVSMVFLTFLVAGCLRLTPPKEEDQERNSFGQLKGYEVFEDRMIVGYEDREALEVFVKSIRAEIVVEIPQLKAASIKLPVEISKIYDRLKKMDLCGIRYVEPVYRRYIVQPVKRNNIGDISLAGQTGDPFMQYQWALKKLGAETAWETASGTGVVIAVLDSPIDGSHPDLEGQFVTGYDTYNDCEIAPGTDGDIAWETSDDHGTHVSGIIAARRDNGVGIAGLAYNAKIMPVNIFVWQWGMIEYAGDDCVARGIVWAVDNGADILSNSWGGSGYSMLLKEAVDYALSRGVAFIASSGNASYKSSSSYPAGYPGVIAVGASTVRDSVADFSNWGEYISVVAPGQNILSCVPEYEEPNYFEESGVAGQPYEYWDGTSMACPYVSALAALLIEKYPGITPFQLMKTLESGAVDLGTPGPDEKSGYGRIEASSTLVLNPDLYDEEGFLRVRVSDRSGRLGIPAVYVTLDREGGLKYYAKTNSEGEASFYAIDQGIYDIYLGGPDYLDTNSPNWRIEEERSETIRGAVLGENTKIDVAFKSTFGADVKTSVEGDFVVKIVDIDGKVYASTPFSRSAFIQFPDLAEGGRYYLIVQGDSPAFDELEPDYADDFESGNFNGGDFDWSLGGDELPYVQSETAKDGSFSARFGAISDMEQRSYFETTVSVAEPSKLEFDLKVSSTPWLCSFRLFIDDSLVAESDGELDWQRVKIPLRAGQHSIRFEMYRLMSFGGYEETAWIDNVTITRDLSVVTAIVNINGDRITAYGTLDDGLAVIDELGGGGLWYSIF